ncbi:hypothetical protein [Candidatus Amarobacter glycogenicus]|uniref:hypothetical protein n=1 Tax=Candidatus Amarobacter glycogenicus TaxID=3140699 RepID=UPI002A10972F|nr:hypothetical protein [Dehalococcoidia bacterium]
MDASGETASTSGELRRSKEGLCLSPAWSKESSCRATLTTLWDDEEGLARVILPKRGSLSVRAVKGQAFAELRRQLAPRVR